MAVKGRASDIRDVSAKERLKIFGKLTYGIFCAVNALLAAGTIFCVIYGMVTREYFFFLALMAALVTFFFVYYGYVAILTRIDHLEATELILEELQQRKSDENSSSPDINVSKT